MEYGIFSSSDLKCSSMTASIFLHALLTTPSVCKQNRCMNWWTLPRHRKVGKHTFKIRALKQVYRQYGSNPAGRCIAMNDWVAVGSAGTRRKARVNREFESSERRGSSRFSMTAKLSVATNPSSMPSASPISRVASYLDCSCLIFVKFGSVTGLSVM